MPDYFTVHELEPKKWVFGPGGGTKHNRFLVTCEGGVYFLQKYDEPSESVPLGKKLGIFTDQNGSKGDHMKMNFEYF